MEPQPNRAPSSPHELTGAWWLPAALAARLAREGHSVVESLRRTHRLLDREQYVQALIDERIHVVGLPHDSAALVMWGESAHGRMLHILTTYGRMETAADALAALEASARSRGAQALNTLARPGWRKLVENAGYTVEPMLLLTKVLSHDSVATD